MKQGVSIEVKQSVLALRRKHSLREVAGLTDLPLGTVKTLCTRSGEFRDNAALRALCTLPEPRLSGATALTVPTLPPQSQITGDSEIDAVLRLRQLRLLRQLGLKPCEVSQLSQLSTSQLLKNKLKTHHLPKSRC